MLSTPITSTGVRRTQNLTAPPTQNTAPVLEFQCLFTFDLRRKQKRWQDGFLRFHTFNKRIMVYDSPSRNFIGDQHWREECVLQDGDEMQLEKPVLVQVGEAIGTTETDLTELLEKRRKPPDVMAVGGANPPRRQLVESVRSTASIRPPVSQPSQLRPKSLNALLGTPKRPIGRATIPTRSPHELRHEVENVDWESERPAKRQVIEANGEGRSIRIGRPVLQTPVAMIVPPAEINRVAQVNRHQSPKGPIQCDMDTTPKPKGHPLPNSRISRQLSSEAAGENEMNRTATRKQPSPASKPKMLESTRNKRAPREQRIHCEVKQTSDRGHPHELGSAIVENANLSSTKSGLANSSHKSIQVLSDGESGSFPKSPKKRMKLQMVSKKPRKKLMYRDLLPQERPREKRSLSCENGVGRKGDERSMSSRASKRADDTLTEYLEEEQGRLADRLNRYNGRLATRGNAVEDVLQEEHTSSCLFVSEDDCDHLPSNRHGMKEKATKSLKPSSKERRPKPPHHRRAPEQNIPKAPSMVHDTALTLSRMDKIMFPSSRRSGPPASAGPLLNEEADADRQEVSASVIPSTPPHKTRQAPAPAKAGSTTLVPSSPGFQTQTRIHQEKHPPEKASPVPHSMTTPADGEISPKIKTSKIQSPKQHSPGIPVPDTSSTIPPSPNILPSKPLPLSKPPREQPPITQSSTPSNPQLSTAPSPTPHSPNLAALVRPPSPTNAPSSLHIHQKPLPAFVAPRPKPRSPLKKSTSDTTSLHTPAPILRPPNSNQKAIAPQRENIGMATRWSKEAWDLFGCGRDGVECSYEDFKRKEGLA